jgi:hypothetical protein
MVIVKDGIIGESSTHREVSNAYKILVGKPEGTRSLGRPRRRCEAPSCCLQNASM